LHEQAVTPITNQIVPWFRASPKERSQSQQFGLYVAPGDREFWPDQIDVLNDGLPEHSSCLLPGDGSVSNPNNDAVEASYAKAIWLEPVSSLPAKTARTGPGRLYKLISCNPGKNASTWDRSFISVAKDGSIHPVAGWE